MMVHNGVLCVICGGVKHKEKKKKEGGSVACDASHGRSAMLTH